MPWHVAGLNLFPQTDLLFPSFGFQFQETPIEAVLPTVVCVGISTPQQFLIEHTIFIYVHEAQQTSKLASRLFRFEFYGHYSAAHQFAAPNCGLWTEVGYRLTGSFGFRRIYPPQSDSSVALMSVGYVQIDGIAVDYSFYTELSRMILLNIVIGLAGRLSTGTAQGNQQKRQHHQAQRPGQSAYLQFALGLEAGARWMITENFGAKAGFQYIHGFEEEFIGSTDFFGLEIGISLFIPTWPSY